jgi:bifunctional non-homologous end joining protein LigD
MLYRVPPAGFVEPCLPVPVAKPPVGPSWIHEIKHDASVWWCGGMLPAFGCSPARALTGRGASPFIAAAVGALRVKSCLIDGEAVACDDDGLPVFERLRGRRQDRDVFLFAFRPA